MVDLEAADGIGAGRAAGAGTAPAAGPLAVVITGEDWLDAICPFLRARDGSWRSASPARDHRCWAVDPPSELPVLTQQRLCLVRDHDGCERFLHARELRSSALARERGAGVETPPVGVPRGRPPIRSGGERGDRVREIVAAMLRLPRISYAAGGLVIMVALAAIVWSGGSPGGGPGSSAGPAIASLTPDASAPVGADGLRRYRVREGDTLRTIADRFGVSVRQLRQANDLGDPPRLEVGVIILVPVDG